eukprot:TRINITY_DN86246_c0_g1_i1.p2 TRINITY_DN86246_c0_g1~~TRINITY_DN86246_c0_g1_i1.p2  ORF type:complete len:124 (-),score=11.27 TRINITY_DN86246_c0_g1_i1:1017-1388(-)
MTPYPPYCLPTDRLPYGSGLAGGASNCSVWLKLEIELSTNKSMASNFHPHQSLPSFTTISTSSSVKSSSTSIKSAMCSSARWAFLGDSNFKWGSNVLKIAKAVMFAPQCERYSAAVLRVQIVS